MLHLNGITKQNETRVYVNIELVFTQARKQSILATPTGNDNMKRLEMFYLNGIPKQLETHMYTNLKLCSHR